VVCVPTKSGCVNEDAVQRWQCMWKQKWKCGRNVRIMKQAEKVPPRIWKRKQAGRQPDI